MCYLLVTVVVEVIICNPLGPLASKSYLKWEEPMNSSIHSVTSLTVR